MTRLWLSASGARWAPSLGILPRLWRAAVTSSASTVSGSVRPRGPASWRILPHALADSFTDASWPRLNDSSWLLAAQYTVSSASCASRSAPFCAAPSSPEKNCSSGNAWGSLFRKAGSRTLDPSTPSTSARASADRSSSARGSFHTCHGLMRRVPTLSDVRAISNLAHRKLSASAQLSARSTSSGSMIVTTTCSLSAYSLAAAS
mmetsp:Transcript_90621/g.256172  ORF Transcript_90621/g.256172 Transcript_90621/m.256172 type:complete len:204 (-) Transcript_90621:5267-5878(-)